MKIVDSEAYICHFPLADPSGQLDPGLPMQNNSAIIIRLLTDEGIEGLRRHGLHHGMAGCADLIKLFLIGRDLSRWRISCRCCARRRSSFPGLVRGGRPLGHNRKATGQPVYRLLGERGTA